MHLDPGLAFGTGTHPTTGLCLEWLEKQDLADRTVLDFGCGSGVLAIAAALLGARRVVAVDNDPQALQATADNAARNGVGERVVSLEAGDFRPQPFDCVLANILASTLVELQPLLCSSLDSGGALALSGILTSQADRVAAAYRVDCGRLESQTRDGWARLTGTRR